MFVLPEAREFPVAIESDAMDGYANKRVYALVGVHGIYRRVARSGNGIKTKRPGAVLGMIPGEDGGKLCEFVRFDEFEAALKLAGFAAPIRGESGGGRESTLDKANETEKATELEAVGA